MNFGFVTETTEYRKLLEQLRAGARVISISGLVAGASRALAVAALQRESGKTFAVVSQTTRDLEPWERDLRFWYCALAGIDNAAGARLVSTNGVFDLLHVGHVRYLAQARALGDALVVAINSDRTVRELKGPDRPVFNEAERAEILAALRYVDYVTVFDDVSPRSLIARLLPDVLVKGGDYGLDQIHGREEVEAAGGKVISLPFVNGASTTTLIDRMKNTDLHG
jgi:D-beta-D-heptose 7-phosphate kinase/D-beta-D-heptose 1-phosphate adenosyltransferase